MEFEALKLAIKEGRTSLGIELGSTRIKAVLIGPDHIPAASGGHTWENRLEDGIWTYSLDDVWKGIQSCYKSLKNEVREKYDVEMTATGAIGVSAMMHGYMAFDSNDKLLVPMRTWRNTMTEEASSELTKLFGFNIPQRWSIAHLYQAMLRKEAHVTDISFLTTLAGYVHWRLTGKKVAGVGDASGIFPIDSTINDYDARMMKQFGEKLSAYGVKWSLADILPRVLIAGEDAGELTAEGAKLIDPDGALISGIPMCPPEGDAGTGMTATNSVAPHTGNVSAGTSVFAMTVLDKALGTVYPEIDMVTTPTGKPVAMVHCNNCMSDLDAWVGLFGEIMDAMGVDYKKYKLYDAVYFAAEKGDADCGGLLAYNYLSGEHNTGLEEGRPLFTRLPDGCFTLANFMRTLLYSALSTLKLGMDILFEKEHVPLDCLVGHGGLFKTERVGQRMMAAAIGVPVAVMESAGEGGAWGVALLAAYRKNKAENETLEAYLEKYVFADSKGSRIEPDPADMKGFAAFLERYKLGLEIEKTAVSAFKK